MRNWDSLHVIRAGAALFVLLLSLYILVYVPVPDSLDGEALLTVAASLARRGSTDMNAIAYSDWVMPENAGMGKLGLDGRDYSKKAIAPSLALIPFVFAADALPPLTTRAVAMLLNPIVTALTAALLFHLIRRLGFSVRAAWWTALLYGAATTAFVYTGTLFGEPLAALAVAAVLLAYARWRDRMRHADLLIMGAGFALLVGVNLVYAVLVPIGALFVSAYPAEGGDRRGRIRLAAVAARAVWFGLPIGLALLGIGAHNIVRFGSPLDSGYRFASGEGFTQPLLVGLYGLFLSPYRGLFWYSPILLAAIPGAIMILRRRRAPSEPQTALPTDQPSGEVRDTRSTALLALALGAGIALAFASWWSWYGGVVFGPRFLIPALPAFSLFLAPVIERVTAWRSRIAALSFGLLVVVSFAVQVVGAAISYIPYYAELKATYFNGSPNAFVGSLDDRVLVDPALSPIFGHARLLLTGFPLQVGWLARGFDPIYLIAAALLAGVGIVLLRRSRPPSRRLGLVTAMIAVCALGLTAWRGSATQPDAESVRTLGAALDDADTLVTATTYYHAAILDLETPARVLTLNAPVTPDDQRAQALWNALLPASTRLAYLTWMPPGDPQDWMARELFEREAVLSEQPLDGHRLLLFTNSAPTPTLAAGIHFGQIELSRWGAAFSEQTLSASFDWTAGDSIPGDYTWFIHVIDADGTILAQQDRAPLGGFAPTTTWQPGDSLRESVAFVLTNPEDAAALRIGWIDPTSGGRLPGVAQDGTPLPDGYAVLPLPGR